MTATIASGTWVLIVFVVLVAGGIWGSLSLRGHVHRINIPDADDADNTAGEPPASQP